MFAVKNVQLCTYILDVQQLCIMVNRVITLPNQTITVEDLYARRYTGTFIVETLIYSDDNLMLCKYSEIDNSLHILVDYFIYMDYGQCSYASFSHFDFGSSHCDRITLLRS